MAERERFWRDLKDQPGLHQLSQLPQELLRPCWGEQLQHAQIELLPGDGCQGDQVAGPNADRLQPLTDGFLHAARDFHIFRVFPFPNA
jgi:hypothetical protein